MRTVKTHPETSINLTPRAEMIMELLNCYMFLFPRASIKSAGEYIGISETNARRYYYGVHHINGFRSNNYTQMRKGAKVTINMNKEKAIKMLANFDVYKKIYNF
jgi:hypothetical protein